MAGISPRDLKLVAFDAQDLAILSLHLQDAVLQVADMAYLPRERRFAAIVNRFDWAKAIAAAEQTAGKPGPRGKPYVRHRTALRFEHVTGAKLSGIDPKARRQALSLLALQFEATSAPAGHVTLIFAGGAAIRLEIECLEAELRDLGAAWGTRSRPAHPDPGSTG